MRSSLGTYLAALGQAHQLGLVFLQTLHVGILCFRRQIATTMIHSNTNAVRKLARDVGSLKVKRYA